MMEVPRDPVGRRSVERAVGQRHPEVLFASRDIVSAADDLVDLANERGGRVNATVALAGVGGDLPAPSVREPVENAHRIIESSSTERRVATSSDNTLHPPPGIELLPRCLPARHVGCSPSRRAKAANTPRSIRAAIGQGGVRHGSTPSPLRYIEEQRSFDMNWTQIEGRWEQLKGEVKSKWAKLTDDDFKIAGGKFDALVGKVVERYGLQKEVARREVHEWADRLGGRIEAIGRTVEGHHSGEASSAHHANPQRH
jgi:uncharacterized protein YjbJ (UPF0337 family)